MWFRLIMGLEWFLTQIPARALPLISLSSYCPYIKVKILILCKIISTLHSAEYTLQQREWGVNKPVHNLWQIGRRFHSLWSCSVWWLDRPLHLTHRLQNPLQTEEHSQFIAKSSVFFSVNNKVIPWPMNRIFLMVTYRLKYSWSGNDLWLESNFLLLPRHSAYGVS